jgi:MFS family permease
MELRQIIRLFIFGYFSFLANFLSFWIAAVLPQVVVNDLHIKDPELVSQVGAFFFSFYFLGIIIGSLAWPYVLKIMSKRGSILLALSMQGIFTALTGLSTNLVLVYACRVFTGAFNNINTVGKDFIFEFAKPAYRQYAFSLKSCFTVAGTFVGPLLGYYLYIWSGSSLRTSLLYLGALYLTAVILFVVVFYIDFGVNENHDHDPEIKRKTTEEERNLLLVNEGENLTETHEQKKRKKQKGIFLVTKEVFKNPSLRNLTIVYFLTNGIYTTKNFILIFYLEASWQEQGLGISPHLVSLVNFCVFFPCFLFLLISPIFVPAKVSYVTVIKQIVIVSIVILLLIPALRDIIPESKAQQYTWLICLLYGLSNFFNPKLFSPFINFYLNNNVDRYSRTSLNSITFIFSTISTAIIITLVSPLLSISLHNPFFKSYAPYNKYFCFVVLSLLLTLNLIYLRENHHRKDSQEQQALPV